MPLDLDLLTSTPDLRSVAPVHARIVCALRYAHVARARRCYCVRDLAVQLGTEAAVHSFHVFLDEAGRAWPEPIALNPPCQPRMSYDEMLLVDCTTAAAHHEMAIFDELLRDMVGSSARRSLWIAARRLMRGLGVVVK